MSLFSTSLFLPMSSSRNVHAPRMLMAVAALSVAAGCVCFAREPYKPTYNLDAIKQNEWVGKQCFDFIPSDRGVLCDVITETWENEEQCAGARETYKLTNASRQIEKVAKRALELENPENKTPEDISNQALFTSLFILDANRPQAFFAHHFNTETSTCSILMLSDLNLLKCDGDDPEVAKACDKLRWAADNNWFDLMQARFAEDPVPVGTEGNPVDAPVSP